MSLLYTHSDTTVYHTELQRIVPWCDGHNLILNATKSKEMVFDPRSVGDHKPVSIKGQVVKQVTQFKYLGITLDCKLQWSFHVEYICSKICQRLYFLRRLRLHGVDKYIKMLFYRATIESIIRYCITTWFCNLTVKSQSITSEPCYEGKENNGDSVSILLKGDF